MNTLHYVGVCAVILALLGGLALRESSRNQSIPLSNLESRGDIAIHGEIGASQPMSDTDSIVSEAIISDRKLHQLHIRIAQLDTQITRLEQQSQALEKQQQAMVGGFNIQIARLEQQSQALEKWQRAMIEKWERLSKNGEPQNVISGNYRAEDTTSKVDEDVIASKRDFVQERITTLEAELASQAADPRWSSEAVEHIKNIFSNESLYGNTLANVVCVTTLCRLDVIHIDQDKYDHFMDEIFSSLEWQSNVFSHTLNKDGSFNTVLYISREGYSLPP